MTQNTEGQDRTQELEKKLETAEQELKKVEEEIEEIVEEIEIEEHGRLHRDKRPPRARRYVIRIDKVKHKVTVSHMTGREILLLADKKPPETYKLTQKFHGGAARSIALDEVVDFRAPGVERFTTLPLDQTEG